MEKPIVFNLLALTVLLIAVPTVLVRCASPDTPSRAADRPARGPSADREPKVVPKPTVMHRGVGSFRVTGDTVIVHEAGHAEAERIATDLARRIERVSPFGLRVAPSSGDEQGRLIILALTGDPGSLGEEGYRLDVLPDRVRLEAAAPAGLFWGVQTIRQLFPPEFEKGAEIQDLDWTLPCLSIEDKPRFGWRGLLLDCGRHFMSKDYVKRMIDLLAYHKMNRLHWHLTEDQGWRIEIEKYPRLTEIGAWRRYDDGTVYGGFYTQEEIREIVAYARERHVTVVPEIEMPGHSVAALASYPEISCTGGPFEVETQWGVHKDVYCAGKEETFLFLTNVLSEVLALFDSEYIHIGGDECPKDRWKSCARCQERIDQEGLADEHELQSWFIKRIENYLVSRGRRLIGWDEILEGGLAPGATVQSWRGMEGAIAAARSGHDAIVSPTSHAYFDYDIATTDLRRVYSFEPVPPGLSRGEERHILGGECNMWTERAPQETVDSKVFPRLLAMCEVLWSDPEGRDYGEFHDRLRHHYERLDILGVDYGPAARPIAIIPSLVAEDHRFEIVLESGEQDVSIRYTLDGTEPSFDSPRYTRPLVLSESAEIRARAYRDGVPYGAEARRRVFKHRALARPVSLGAAYSPKYTGGGDRTLVDGLTGSVDFREGFWQGYLHDDLDATIDLGRGQPIKTITVRFLQNSNSWIFLPTAIEFDLSVDGVNFETAATVTHDVSQKNPDAIIKEFSVSCDGSEARHIRIRARNVGCCPAWHPGAGGRAWIFADEIIVE